ncbi:transglutaminase TgpA family protein, partial [Glycomyces tarimensis]
RGQGLQTLAMGAALLLVLTALFNDGTAILFLMPTPDTFAHWLTLMGHGVNDIIMMAPPVDPEGGILFLTMLGVGSVAILHDMFIVGLRTPALSGLTLLTMYLVPVSVAPDATAWFWFVLPAVAYLWVLADDNLRRISRFGHRFTGAGKLVGPRFPSPLAATARVSAAVFVAITLLLLAVVPTNTSGLVDQVAQGYGDGPGAGEDALGALDPWAQLSGSLNRPDPVDVLRITTDDPSPRYLRMHVADVLTNEGFHPSGYDDLDPLDSLTYGGGDLYTAEIENLALPDQVAPVYGRPTEITLGDEWGVEPFTGVIASEDSSLADVDGYTLQYTDPDWDAGTLDRAPEMAPDDPRFDRNTAHPNVPELTTLAETVFAEADTTHQKVLATLDFLSPANGFSYSLETADAGSEEAVLNFLETRQGYCQQYAATMAWMLRESDVPARVAIGLTTGNYSDGAWTVTSDNFHAWVEVYFEGPGWVPFDPTPGGGVADPVNFPWSSEPSEADEPGGATEEPAADTNPSAQANEEPTLAEELQPDEQRTAPGQAAPGGPGGPNPAWLALLGLLAVPFIPALWRSGLRRSRLGPTRLSAQSAWDETVDLSVDYGAAIGDALTPRQAAATLAEAVPDARPAAEALASAVEFDRYSGRGADTTTLPAALTDLRASLDRGSDARTRLQARLWPTSLATRLAERQGRTANRVAGLRERVRWPRRSNNRRDGTVT